MSSAVAEPTPNPDLTPSAPSSSPYRAAVLAKVTTPVPGLVLERVCQARVCHAPVGVGALSLSQAPAVL